MQENSVGECFPNGERTLGAGVVRCFLVVGERYVLGERWGYLVAMSADVPGMTHGEP